MRRETPPRSVIFICLILVIEPMSNATDRAAHTEAAAWLLLVDAGDAQGSWDAAGGVFRTAVTPEVWTEQLPAARGPLGPLTSRTFAVEQHVAELPGAPPGEYVVQQYHCVYDARRAVVETVSLQLEPDGVWRVVGYFIR